MVRSAAVVADAIFRIENSVLEAKKATQQQLNEVIILVKDYKDIIREIDEEHGVTTDVSYMDGHIKTIESFL
jgi:type IV secretory pathway ATPase VirB11/archaellum biosynthesis ATPase